ncbi:Probable WRKY transcription factor 35 [Linum perenne]
MEMENYQGDLTDVVRAGASSSSLPPDSSSSWDFPSPSSSTFSDALLHDTTAVLSAGGVHHHNLFGDPFSNFHDPLLHAPIEIVPTYFPPPPPPKLDLLAAAAGNGGGGFDFMSDATGGGTSSTTASSSITTPPLIPAYNQNKMFGGIQISPATAAVGLKGGEDQMIKNNNNKNSQSNNYSVAGPVQISSPRNLGIKRRKSQAKKVVCIPAPATVNSRPSGEVVPSDLWAWRKYGQKPIKGSPYPRGYYRCSSSKGCSARKQVERSRTDPNMLVITYTSEHNHPWPTQRNALAGSTRAHPHTNTKHHISHISTTATSSSSKKNTTTSSSLNNDNHATSSSNPNKDVAAACSMSSNEDDDDVDKADVDHPTDTMMLEIDGGTEFSNSYRPMLMGSAAPDHDFFAGLGEIEGGDPLQLLLSSGDDPVVADQGKEVEPLFSSMFDWSSCSADEDSKLPRVED